jgi:hypothetical protein
MEPSHILARLLVRGCLDTSIPYTREEAAPGAPAKPARGDPRREWYQRTVYIDASGRETDAPPDLTKMAPPAAVFDKKNLSAAAVTDLLFGVGAQCHWDRARDTIIYNAHDHISLETCRTNGYDYIASGLAALFARMRLPRYLPSDWVKIVRGLVEAGREMAHALVISNTIEEAVGGFIRG